jgi:hypothetical protein
LASGTFPRPGQNGSVHFAAVGLAALTAFEIFADKAKLSTHQKNALDFC